MLENLLLGFSVSLSLTNLFWCFVGIVVGVFVGVLPGLGSAATIAMLLPITYFLDTTPAIIMLAGIWYGSMFGGAVTAILLNIPGQSTAVMTALDGYQMARQGKAGAALGASVFASFFGGLIGFLGLVLVAPPLAEFALQFGPPEYFALTVTGLTLVTYLATQSVPKSLCAALLGLLLGSVGIDPVSAAARFTYGTLTLENGLQIVPVIMGLFGIAEVFKMIESSLTAPNDATRLRERRSVIPNRGEWRAMAAPISAGGLIGFFVGLLPGAGAAIASYVSYVLVKRWSRHGAQFGTGRIEGVAAPEAGNNAATCGAIIPLLTLGLPADIVPAIMLGAFLLHGVTPGPMMMLQTPEMFWGIVTSFLVGTVMVVLVMLPFINLFARITELPKSIMAPLIVLVTLAGAYGVNNSAVEIWIMLGFGVLGYLMNKFEYPLPPLILAFVLGPILESSFRQSLIMGQGDFGIFVSRPFTAAILAVGLFMVFSPLMRIVRLKLGRASSRAAR
ncbi:MAG: tripartite tricarboxylate transporter permease [Burkholderiales bacterium]